MWSKLKRLDEEEIVLSDGRYIELLRGSRPRN